MVVVVVARVVDVVVGCDTSSVVDVTAASDPDEQAAISSVRARKGMLRRFKLLLLALGGGISRRETRKPLAPRVSYVAQHEDSTWLPRSMTGFTVAAQRRVLTGLRSTCWGQYVPGPAELTSG